MDVTFVLEDERTFSIEVGFFDSFQEIKEKIKKYRGIPIDRQTLLFNGEVLENEAVISTTDICEDSRVQLLLASDSGNPATPPALSPPPSPPRHELPEPQLLSSPSQEYHPIETLVPQSPATLSAEFPPPPMPYDSPPPPNRNELEELEEMLLEITDAPTPNRDEIEELLRSIMDAPPQPELNQMPPPPQTPMTVSENTLPLPPPSPPPPTRVEFMVKIVEYKARPFSVEMNLDDTVLQLKEKIYRMKKPRNLKANEMEVRIKSGLELHDRWSLRDCGMLSVSHVYVRKKLSQPGSQRMSAVAAADAVLGAKMLNVMVVPKGGTHKIPIEINAFNRVEDLRYELEKFHKRALPENGRYFFRYEKNGHVMTETHAFNWYGIEEGDTIEITPEYVSDDQPNPKE